MGHGARGRIVMIEMFHVILICMFAVALSVIVGVMTIAMTAAIIGGIFLALFSTANFISKLWR